VKTPSRRRIATERVVRIHDPDSFNLDPAGLTTLKGLLILTHHGLVKLAVSGSIGVFNFDARLVEEVKLETPVHGAAHQNGISLVGQRPGKCVAELAIRTCSSPMGVWGLRYSLRC
jgi:hypothetical protein